MLSMKYLRAHPSSKPLQFLFGSCVTVNLKEAKIRLQQMQYIYWDLSLREAKSNMSFESRYF